MHPDLEGISEHMKMPGLGILSQAQQNVFLHIMLIDTILPYLVFFRPRTPLKY
jgi:hypothetical protein